MRRAYLASVLTILLTTGVWAAEKGLVAHWDFNEGSGAVLHDRSGNGNHGTIAGAEWVKVDGAYALEFDGVDDFVDCGKGPGLDIKDVITVEAWLYPAAMPTVPSEWIIAGKQQDVYALCYYMTGWCWWYLSGGDNAAQAPVGVGQWHHLAGTFDGKTATLYVDGDVKCSRTSKYATITSRKDLRFLIGRPPFSGMIDEVKVYQRALSAEEVRRHYVSEMGAKLTRASSVEQGQRLEGDGFTLKVGHRGGMELIIGDDSYFIESAFSRPGQKMRWNRLSERPSDNPAWELVITESGGREIVVGAKGKDYSLERKLRLHKRKVRVSDTLTNTGDSAVGIIVKNHIIASQPFRECLLGGMAANSISGSAANPTIYTAQEGSRLGMVAEDNISRSQGEATSALNRATFSIGHFGLAPGKSRALEWSLYPLDRSADYFSLINRIREDWKSNFTIDGPFEFGEVYPERYAGVDVLRRQFARKPVKFLALTRMFEYDLLPMTRQEYKRHVTATMRLLKEANPDIKVLASIETFCPSLLYYPGRIKGRERLDAFIKAHAGGSVVTLPMELNKFLEKTNASAAWLDSLYRTSDGLFQMEIFRWGGRTMTAFYAFPAAGNCQHAHLMDQVKFLIDEVGVDGIYFDGFAVGGPHYGEWDGMSVDIDPHTGSIQRRHTNTVLAGIGPRAEIAEYILSRGKALIGNGGAAAVREEQSVPVFRFIENDPPPFRAGEKPPLNARMCGLQLGSPIALMGAWGSAENIYKATIAYLRHGLVCYFYNSNFSETGEGSGDYGPFRHMFPITPVALHEGWIEGKERIITCVSGDYVWRGNEKPIVCLFDSVGREKSHGLAIKKVDDGWKIGVTLGDWQEIAVIETSGTAKSTQ